MSQLNQEDDQPYAVLPQRQPRAKRMRQSEPESDQPAQQANSEVGDAVKPAAAAAELPSATKGPIPSPSSAGGDSQQGGGQDEYDSDISKQENEKVEKGNNELELVDYRSAKVRDYNFEYLDHTADVQLHAWGETLQEAFENVGLAMFNYMTPLKGIDKASTLSKTYEAEGHDLQSLLFHYLDELLFGFATEFFVPRQLKITSFDRENWRVVAEGVGETFDRQRHACGTEIKAITYSAMQINETPNDAEIFVIVDI